MKRAKKPWHRRHYYLDGVPIPNSRVRGMVSVAWKEYWCMSNCHRPIKPGDKLVRILVVGANEMHLECYVDDNGGEGTILGVKTTPGGFAMATRVDCQRFFPKEEEAEALAK